MNSPTAAARAMAVKDYVLEKGEGVQTWEERPAQEAFRPTPVGVNRRPGGLGSVREARGRIGRRRGRGRRCLRGARATEVGEESVILFGEGVGGSRGVGGLIAGLGAPEESVAPRKTQELRRPCPRAPRPQGRPPRVRLTPRP